MRRGSAKALMATVATLSLSLLAACSRREVPSASGMTAESAAAWLAAVAAGQSSPARALAAAGAGSLAPVPVPQEIAQVAAAEGLLPDFFVAATFHEFDFKLWYDAFFLRRIARDLIREGEDPLAALLAGVSRQVRPEEKEFGPLPWPAAIWVRQYGVCDRSSWLFAELAYQLGFDAVVVYLRNPQTGVSAHTICEVRHAAGQVWTVDALSGRMLAGRSVRDLAADPELAAEFWPERPDWREQLAGVQYWLPVYPQDCAERNQRLAALLGASLGADLPRFGEEPMARLRRVREIFAPADVNIWPFPFRVMKQEPLAGARQ